MSGGIAYYTGSTIAINTPGSSGQPLVSQGSGAPVGYLRLLRQVTDPGGTRQAAQRGARQAAVLLPGSDRVAHRSLAEWGARAHAQAQPMPAPAA